MKDDKYYLDNAIHFAGVASKELLATTYCLEEMHNLPNDVYNEIRRINAEVSTIKDKLRNLYSKLN